MNAVEFKIGGIKCDNPDCDYKDMTVEFKEYQEWLNKPCPKCGANLLTQADLDATRTLIKIVNVVNLLARPFMFLLKKQKKVKVSAEFNGSGKVTFKEVDE